MQLNLIEWTVSGHFELRTFRTFLSRKKMRVKKIFLWDMFWISKKVSFLPVTYYYSSCWKWNVKILHSKTTVLNGFFHSRKKVGRKFHIKSALFQVKHSPTVTGKLGHWNIGSQNIGTQQLLMWKIGTRNIDSQNFGALDYLLHGRLGHNTIHSLYDSPTVCFSCLLSRVRDGQSPPWGGDT